MHYEAGDDMEATEEVFAKNCHIEIIPPKQDSEKLEDDLQLFAAKLGRVMESGFTASLTDNAMGLLAFQGQEDTPCDIGIHLLYDCRCVVQLLKACIYRRCGCRCGGSA